MDNLPVSNILHRKTRTVLSAAGVALGVVLVVMTVGLAHGMLDDTGRRNAAVTAEIMFNPAGASFGLDLSPTLSLSADLADKLKQVEGVSDAVPVARYVKGTLGGLVDGIDYDGFTRVSPIRVIEGRPLAKAGDEVIIDQVLEHARKVKVGGSIEVFGRPFKVVGIYAPESLGRVKVPLATLQTFVNRPGLCSMILVKVNDPAQQDAVAQRIRSQFPENVLFFTRDLPALYQAGIPALNTFLNVVVALSIVISGLIILLAMYTTVTERTRQIGILKSMGATKAWIAAEIQKEALLITLLGVMGGFAASAAGRYGVQHLTSLKIELQGVWLLYALGLGVVSGALGAMYPALRAANQDPIKALSFE
ncbi:MAG TPA: ABC transporter permease [Blastocatellia bacterium]|nr:ABC transporter permease [Blastocatellia bacterium]